MGNRPIITPLEPQVTGKIFEQEIRVDDDLTFLLQGRKESFPKKIVFYCLYFMTCGVFYLVCRWYVSIQKLKTNPSSLANSDCIFIKNQWGQLTLLNIEKIKYGGLFSFTFPAYFLKHNNKDHLLDTLAFFEYRYFKFLFNPVSGKFEANYIWKNPAWSTVKNVLDSKDSKENFNQKISIFDQNRIEIKEKSNIELLLDEVLHPFFIFQIFSICLWSFDSYYW